MSVNQADLAYGQAVAVKQDNRIIPGRYIRFDYDEAHADAPYIVTTTNGEMNVSADDLFIMDGLNEPIDPHRFGDTPETASAFLDDLQTRMLASDEYGHDKLATADPHLWFIRNRLQSIEVPGDCDYDHISVVIEDDYFDDPVDAFEWIMNEAIKNDRDVIQDFVNEQLHTICGEKNRNLCLTYDKYGDIDLWYVDPVNGTSCYGIPTMIGSDTKTKRLLTNAEIAQVFIALTNVTPFDEVSSALPESMRIVYWYDVWGCVPNAVFLTKDAAEQHLKLNRNHYNRDAHIYLDCAFRNPEFEHLSRILRQVDWEKSALVMKHPVFRYPA